MDRMDSIFAVGLGAFLLAVIGMAGGWGEASGWAQTLVTIIAAMVALTIYRRQRIDALADREFALRQDQVVAMMQVAAGMRAWMRKSVIAIQELNAFQASNGAAGQNSVRIPEFDINLDHVARMPIAQAKVVYSILEHRERGYEQVFAVADVVDADEAIGTSYAETAKLFRRSRKMYIQLAKETGLHPYTSLKFELEAINRAAADGRVRDWKSLP